MCLWRLRQGSITVRLGRVHTLFLAVDARHSDVGSEAGQDVGIKASTALNRRRYRALRTQTVTPAEMKFAARDRTSPPERVFS